MRKTPPLKSLKAFESVARRQSIEAASEELHVTHGAVSRHIKQLESVLNVSLFDRTKRSLSLTPRGEKYFKQISAAFDLIDEATENLYQLERKENVLGISTTHSFASKWLMPRLPQFSAASPDVEVWLSLDQQLDSFSSSNVDIGIRCGKPPWPGVEAWPLLSDRLLPVCSPSLLPEDPRQQEVSVLDSMTLLHDQDPNAQWSLWFEQYSKQQSSRLPGPRFASSDVLIQAAIAGQGVALVSEVLAQQEIANGSLVVLFDKPVEIGNYFWLVMPERSKRKNKVLAFSRWLTTQPDIQLTGMGDD